MDKYEEKPTLMKVHKCEIIKTSKGGTQMIVDMNKINSLVIEKGLSYTELSKKSGISKQHLSRMKSNNGYNVRSKTVSSLAYALDVNYRVFTRED